jgi:hypothetical protein
MDRMNLKSRPREIVQVAMAHRAAPTDVVLQFWGIQQRPWETLGLLVFSVGLSVGAWWLSDSMLIASISLGSLLLAGGRAWCPIRWELGLGGITETVWFFRRKIPWIAIARFEIGEEGVWLFANRTGESHPGLFLEFGERRDAVIGCIEYYLGTWAATGNASTIAHAVPPVPTETL